MSQMSRMMMSDVTGLLTGKIYSALHFVSLKRHHYAAWHSKSSLWSITATIMTRVSVGRNAQEIWWIDIKFIEKCVADNQLILVRLYIIGIMNILHAWKLSAWTFDNSNVDTLTDMPRASIIATRNSRNASLRFTIMLYYT